MVRGMYWEPAMGGVLDPMHPAVGAPRLPVTG